MRRGRRLSKWLLILLMLGMVGGAAYYVLLPQLQTHVRVSIGDGVFRAQVADQDTEHQTSAKKMAKLGRENAMLLVYDKDGSWPISMKDAEAPIDAVWLNEKKEVVYIVKNIPPESYPFDTYESKNEARYVLKLPAGTVDDKKIVVGTTATFNEDEIEGWRL